MIESEGAALRNEGVEVEGEEEMYAADSTTTQNPSRRWYLLFNNRAGGLALG